MKTTATSTDQLNEIYEFNKDAFISDPFKGSFHNLLWQLIINRVAENTIQTFYDVYHEGEYVLARVIANEPGFINTGVYFKDCTPEDHAKKICEYLNDKIFNQTPSESDKIVSTSFVKQINLEAFLQDS